ncbi:MAG TPA: hypothetical protein VIG99_21265 [Myxococcaceae bacterium]|jgi:TolB-like protein
MTTALIVLLLAAAPQKVAVMTMDAGEGITDKTAAAVTEAVIAEVRRQPNLQVVTPQEIATLLGFERQKQLLGCHEDTSCMAEIGSALGVDRLLMGSLAKLGASWLVHLKLIDASKGSAVGQSDRRLKDKNIDDVLDSLPPMVAELFGRAPPPAAAVVAPPPVAPLPAVTTVKTESGGTDEPAEVKEGLRKKLVLITDGKGHYVAVAGYEHSEDGFFAGDGKSFWLQRVIGSGAEGDIKFNMNFWDPRIPAAYQRAIDMDHGKYTMQCGDKEIPYQVVAKGEAESIMKKARFFKPRWRRAALAIARDDSGNYFVVDGAREDNDETRKPRLFTGPKGGMHEVPLRDTISDAKGMIVISEAGKLRIPPSGDEAEWTDGRGAVLKLTKLELNPREAKLIYKELGIYKDDPLRTACDPHQ